MLTDSLSSKHRFGFTAEQICGVFEDTTDSLSSKHRFAEVYCSARVNMHTSAYVSIRQHTSAYVSIRQHTSAYVSIRQHTLVSICPHTITHIYTCVLILHMCPHTSICVLILLYMCPHNARINVSSYYHTYLAV
jgi:hypothetical protein